MWRDLDEKIFSIVRWLLLIYGVAISDPLSDAAY